MSRRPRQLSLPTPRTWGGRRRGAGRKLTPGRRPTVPHRSRPPHVGAHPIHVTLRAVDALRCLRSARVFPAVRRAIAAAGHFDFRIIQFSVQNDHVHVLAEAEDGRALSGGVRGLAIRLARAVNRTLGRKGRVWGSRYHARALTTPRAVRHALVYVADELQEASPAHWPRARSVLVSCMVRRLAHARTPRRSRSAARRGGAYLARAYRLAATRPHPRGRAAEMTARKRKPPFFEVGTVYSLTEPNGRTQLMRCVKRGRYKGQPAVFLEPVTAPRKRRRNRRRPVRSRPRARR